jgi:hypothetical protein
VRRLPHVGTAGLDAVVRTDRHVDFFGAVAVQVPDQKRVAAIRVGVPPFERAGDASAELLGRFVGDLRLLGGDDDASGQRQGCTQPRDCPSIH